MLRARSLFCLETLELSHYPIRSYEGSITKHSLYSKLYLFSVIVQLTLTFLVTLYCFLAMAKRLINDNEWHSWKQLYNKKYESDEEEKFRYTIWNETRKMIERHNSDKSKTYKLGMNQFGDMVLFLIQLIHFYRFFITVKKPPFCNYLLTCMPSSFIINLIIQNTKDTFPVQVI